MCQYIEPRGQELLCLQLKLLAKVSLTELYRKRDHLWKARVARIVQTSILVGRQPPLVADTQPEVVVGGNHFSVAVCCGPGISHHAGTWESLRMKSAEKPDALTVSRLFARGHDGSESEVHQRPGPTRCAGGLTPRRWGGSRDNCSALLELGLC